VTEIEIGGQQYRIGKMDAMRQFHVARRLAPVLASLGISATELDGIDLFSVLGPVSEVLAKMPNEDVEYVIGSCLSVVHRREGEKWAQVQSPLPQARLMYADIDMPVMVRLAVEVVKDNLGGFFADLPAAGPATS
jgi:hypothetical protein